MTFVYNNWKNNTSVFYFNETLISLDFPGKIVIKRASRLECTEKIDFVHKFVHKN